MAKAKRVTPEVGQYYTARGYLFRVDDVKDGEVYYVRWKGDEQMGCPARVTIEDWEQGMAKWEGKPTDGRAIAAEILP